jgi:hypothetical protein
MLRQSLFGRLSNQLNPDGTIAQSAFFGQSPTQVIEKNRLIINMFRPVRTWTDLMCDAMQTVTTSWTK